MTTFGPSLLRQTLDPGRTVGGRVDDREQRLGPDAGGQRFDNEGARS